MKTRYVISSIPLKYSLDRGDPAVAGPLVNAITAAGAIRTTRLEQPLTQAAKAAATARVKKQFSEGRLKFTASTQPRDPAGKFRRVLARLKLNLGDQATEQLAEQLENAEAAGAIGNFAEAKAAGTEVIKLVKDVDEGDLKKGTINNIRKGASALGKLLAELPLPQGDSSAKVRFSDLPEPTSKLIQSLLKRVDAKLDNEDAAKYTAILKNFMAGGRMMDSDSLSAELSKIIRVLA